MALFGNKQVVAVRDILRMVGEKPGREGLRETPERFLKALTEQCSGYHQDAKSVFKTFEDGAEGYDEIIIETNIPFYSLCEHHLAPFFGVAHVGYIPDGRVVGLSKMVRLMEVFARRLQVQERLTRQVAECMNKELEPLAVGVVIQGRHMCMEQRGVRARGVITTTSALIGGFRDNPSAKAEFMNLVAQGRNGVTI